ncbi:MAG: roadblock/LC7 domain-containing protein [Pseudomonadota bacterium]
MSVNVILDKLCAHNEGVIGCLVTHGQATHHNFADPYSLVDAEAIGEEASQIFELLETLENPEPEVSEVFLEMPNHSVFARRMDDGVLVVLNKAVDRRVFKRLKVGVNLFVKPLKRELTSPSAPAPRTAAPAQEAPSAGGDDAPKRPRRMYRGVEY